MVKYFRDFLEFDDHHENFCHEIFFTAAQSTGLDTSQSRITNELRKVGKITKI